MKIQIALCLTLMMLAPALLPAQSGGPGDAHTGPTDAQGSTVGPPPTKPRPNPDAAGIYHVGDGVTPPILISSVEPNFSDRARKEKISGSYTISMLVDADGNTQDLTITKSVADSVSVKHQRAARELDEKAMDAARQYRFKPATFAGKPVAVTIHVAVNFQIY